MNNLFDIKSLNKKAEEVNLEKNNLKGRRKELDKWIKNLEIGILDNSKEEELQGEFLKDIFSKVLNAVNKTDGKEKWNIQRETKTKVDGQKADAVLGFFSNESEDIRAVIELKSPNVNLDLKQHRKNDNRTPIEQAFSYAPKYGKNCKWIIVSNYKEIRLYRSSDMLEYHIFYLKDLKNDLEFKKFIYLLSFNALMGIKDQKSKVEELTEEYKKNQEIIEKEFYNKYKNVRIKIFNIIKEKNKNINKDILIEKVQKLLDRFLFICFCEDKGLLPKNIYHNTVENGKKINDISETFTSLCRYIDEGSVKRNICKFNGGLFRNDEILNNLIIDDEVFAHLEIISDYDFDSELNENILGHIFEQSISDIEELKNQDKNKRKKDGIFYTPKYITKYMVETVIKNWLNDKKKKLGEDNLPNITEKDVFKKSKNYKKNLEFWQKLRNELRNIKIIDPACGSGAFLITAFEYLKKNFDYINDKIADLDGARNLFDDIENDILKNNLYGVDINNESVEITKLSLWLKTANKGKELVSLDENIKCGNSLIDDANITEKAFNWKQEFKEVFDNGGFDIVIGNPPYVGTKQININERNYFWLRYNEIIFSEIDLYELFIYKSVKELLKKDGELAFITPNSYFTNNSFELLRKYIISNTTILQIIDFPYRFYPFVDVNTETAIIVLKKNTINNEKNMVNFLVSNKNIKNLFLLNNIKSSVLISQEEIKKILDNKIIVNLNLILKKLLNNKKRFGDFLELHKGWMSAPKEIKVNDETINKAVFTKNEVIEQNIMNYCDEYLEGRDIHRYFFDKVDKFVYSLDIDKKTKKWHFSPKIILQRIVGQNKNKIFATVDFSNKIIFPNANLINLKNDNMNIKFFLTVLNSTLISYFYNLYYGESNTNLTKVAFENIPLPNIENIEEVEFVYKCDSMLELHKSLNELKDKFLGNIQREFNLEKISKKLTNWYLLSYTEFLKEIEKNKVKISLNTKAEWESYFLEERDKILKIRKEIEETDNEIDKMVYTLYELTDEEIQIIENSI